MHFEILKNDDATRYRVCFCSLLIYSNLVLHFIPKQVICFTPNGWFRYDTVSTGYVAKR